MFSEVFQMDKILGFCEKLWYVIGTNILFLFSNLGSRLDANGTYLVYKGPSSLKSVLLFSFPRNDGLHLT